MPFKTFSSTDAKWDLWWKQVENQIAQESNTGLAAQMEAPVWSDSVWDLERKFLKNQKIQG